MKGKPIIKRWTNNEFDFYIGIEATLIQLIASMLFFLFSPPGSPRLMVLDSYHIDKIDLNFGVMDEVVPEIWTGS